MFERSPLQWIGYFIMVFGAIILISIPYFGTPANNFQHFCIPSLCEIVGTLFIAAGGRFRE